MHIYLKTISIIITAIIGILGTKYDFRKQGKITKHGILAVSGIVIFALISIIVQCSDSVEEIKRQEAANQKTQKLDSSITKNINETVSLGRELKTDYTNQINISKELDLKIVKSQVIVGEMHKDLKYYQDSIQIGLKRLSSPLSDIFFTYNLVYDSIDLRFPHYYNRLVENQINEYGKDFLKEDYIVTAQDTLLPDTLEDKFRELIYSSLDVEISSHSEKLSSDNRNIDLSYITIAFSSSLSDRYMKNPNVKKFKFHSFYQPEILLTVDLKNKTITQSIEYCGIWQVANNNSIISKYDLFENRLNQNKSLNIFFNNRNKKFHSPEIEIFRIELSDKLQYGVNEAISFSEEKFKEFKSNRAFKIDKIFKSCLLSAGKVN